MYQKYFIKANNTLSCITKTVASRSRVVIIQELWNSVYISASISGLPTTGKTWVYWNELSRRPPT